MNIQNLRAQKNSFLLIFKLIKQTQVKFVREPAHGDGDDDHEDQEDEKARADDDEGDVGLHHQRRLGPVHLKIIVKTKKYLEFEKNIWFPPWL